jgi:hypothetical protein
MLESAFHKEPIPQPFVNEKHFPIAVSKAQLADLAIAPDFAGSCLSQSGNDDRQFVNALSIRRFLTWTIGSC